MNMLNNDLSNEFATIGKDILYWRKWAIRIDMTHLNLLIFDISFWQLFVVNFFDVW